MQIKFTINSNFNFPLLRKKWHSTDLRFLNNQITISMITILETVEYPFKFSVRVILSKEKVTVICKSKFDLFTNLFVFLCLCKMRCKAFKLPSAVSTDLIKSWVSWKRFGIINTYWLFWSKYDWTLKKPFVLWRSGPVRILRPLL